MLIFLRHSAFDYLPTSRRKAGHGLCDTQATQPTDVARLGTACVIHRLHSLLTSQGWAQPVWYTGYTAYWRRKAGHGLCDTRAT